MSELFIQCISLLLLWGGLNLCEYKVTKQYHQVTGQWQKLDMINCGYYSVSELGYDWCKEAQSFEYTAGQYYKLICLNLLCAGCFKTLLL